MCRGETGRGAKRSATESFVRFEIGGRAAMFETISRANDPDNRNEFLQRCREGPWAAVHRVWRDGSERFGVGDAKTEVDIDGAIASSPLQLSWIPGVQRQRLEVEIYRNGEKEVLCEDFHLDVDEWGRNSWKSERKREWERRKYVQPRLVTAGAKQIVRVT